MPTKKHNQIRKLPKKFTPGFLATLDQRTELYKVLRCNYDTIVMDLGGKELSYVKQCLVERFV